MRKPGRGIRRIVDPGRNWEAISGLPGNPGLQLGVSYCEKGPGREDSLKQGLTAESHSSY